MEKNSLKFIISLYKKHSILFVFALIGSVLEAGALSGFVYILKNVIDDIFVEKNYNKLILIISILISLAIFKQIGFFLKNYLYPVIILKIIRELREKIYKNILEAEISYLNRLSIGEIVSRATNDIERFSIMLSSLGTNVITETLTIIGIIGLLIYTDWKLFLIFVIVIPFLALVLNHFGEKRKKYAKLVQESLAEFTSHLSQILNGLETVKLFKKEVFQRIFNKLNQKLFQREVKSRLYETVYLSSVEIIAYIGVVGIISYGGYRVIKGEITAGQFFSFLGGVLVLVNSMQILQRGLVNLKGITPIIERLQTLLNIPKEKGGTKPFKSLKKEITYQNAYVKIGDREILNNINLKIRKGEKVAIIGLSGSGKTTLVKLLPRLIKDYDGKILIDETELTKFEISSLRERFGVLSQEVFIFNDTVRNNLLIAKPNAKEEELFEALKKAKAEFIFKLPEGLDTKLGEKGSVLSGGERQRLALARLFLKNPEILIIDEGTSALDVETEEKVAKELIKSFKDKTVLMITHRLSLLNVVDRVIVMENGKIVEEGRVKELKLRNGLLNRFLQISKEIEN
ncbi:MAG: ABC transporter ATP-binding protein [Persephonella sp.]|nr:MAG: ABC transporter ATP-binding protein [Persephonella sp.]